MSRLLLIKLLIVITLLGPIGANILKEEVPWSGQLRNQTLGELFARFEGWADVAHSTELRFTKPLPNELRNQRIDRFEIDDEPRPTFEAVIQAAFKEVRRTIRLEPRERGIEVIHLFTRTYSVPPPTRSLLRKRGRLSTAGFQAELEAKGWRFSEDFLVDYHASHHTLVAFGRLEDLDKIGRFLGQ